MDRKTARFELRLTPRERAALDRKAKRLGMTPSQYVRTILAHSDDSHIAIIDTGPLRRTLFELHRHGVNLNQLMRFLNTYGIKDYNVREVRHALDKELVAFEEVRAALRSVEREAGLHNVHVRLNPEEGND